MTTTGQANSSSTARSELEDANHTPSDSSIEAKTTRPKASGRFRSTLGFLLRVATFGVVVQVLCTLLAFLHPLLELAAHFSMHALCVALIAVICAILLRSWLSTLLLGISLILLLAITQPVSLFTGTPAPATKQEKSIKVLSWNLLSVNRQLEEVQSIVAQEDPDLIVFIEVRPGMLNGMPEVLRKYPNYVERPQWGGEGIAVLSKSPKTLFRFEDFEFPIQPAVVVSIPKTSSMEQNQVDESADSILKLVALHTLSPLPISRAEIRDRQLRSLRDWAESESGDLCICGDFNITPWAPAFRALIDDGFVDSRNGSGSNGASWPRQISFLGIPIDHAITKGDCRIIDRRVLSKGPGSDHLPLVFTLVY